MVMNRLAHILRGWDAFLVRLFRVDESSQSGTSFEDVIMHHVAHVLREWNVGLESERQPGELALREWIRKNRNQDPLETWTETRGAVAPVNRALINIQLTIVKAELQEILEVYEAISPEYRLETLHKLQKLIPTAQTLVEETGDKELREIVASIVAQVANTEAAPG